MPLRPTNRWADPTQHPPDGKPPNARRKTVWEHYNESARYIDFEREREWGDTADTTLVFAGLFAAFLSAFITISLPTLQPSTPDLTLAAIVHMTHQLSNTSAFNPPFPLPTFTPPKNAVIVNALFFASLALIISAAFLAILVKGWLHEFDRGMQSITIPELHAKEREGRLLGLERWRVGEIMALLHILLQTSLTLFCVGLIVFLQGINFVCAIVFQVIFAIMALLYVLTKISALFDHFSPFSTPISHGLRKWLRIIGWELPEMWAEQVQAFKSLIRYTQHHWRDWCFAGIFVAVLLFRMLVHLLLIITRAVPWYPRSKILKRERRHQKSQTVRATAPALNRLERVTVKAPESTQTLLSIFDEALNPSIQILPSSRWSDILECLSVGDSDLSLRRARALACVLAFVPRSWGDSTFTLPLTPMILRQLDENGSHPVDILVYYLLQVLLHSVYIFHNDYNEATNDILTEWHWNQMCIAISNLRVYDDVTLWCVTELAKLAGRYDLSTWIIKQGPLLRAITRYLEAAAGRRFLRKEKLKTLIIRTLQAFHPSTANSNPVSFRGIKPLTVGSDIFGAVQEPTLQTIDFRALLQAWSSVSDRYNIMSLHILPMNAIIRSYRNLFPNRDDLCPLIPQIVQGTDVVQLIQVGLDGYVRQLLETYDTWVAEDTEQVDLDALKALNDADLATYEAQSPWLRLYIDTRLARPTTLQSTEIKSMRWHDNRAFDSIATIRICDYENEKLSPEPALLELFSNSSSLEAHFRLFSLLKDSDTSVDPALASIAPRLIEQLVSNLDRVICTTFPHLSQRWTSMDLEAHFFLMETIHPKWGILSQEWRSVFARELLEKRFTAYMKFLALLKSYFERDVQYGVSTSRTQPHLQGIAGTVTGEPTTPMEKGGESRKDTFQDTIRGYHEKWKVAARNYLPFLANVIQEAPEYVTVDVAGRIKRELLCLPDYFGDESTRSNLLNVLGRAD